MGPNSNNQLPITKAFHRLFNVVLTTTIILSLNSQAFAQKVALIPNKKTSTAISKNARPSKSTTSRKNTVASKKQKNSSSRSSIDQQILAQAQSLQGNSVKIYSDDTYKTSAKKRATRKSTRSSVRSSVAQAGGASTFGPSNTVDLEESIPAKRANISLELEEAKKDAQPTHKLNGSVGITVGRDDNLDLDRYGRKGGFFEMKPSLSYEGSLFSGSFGARIKDFSDQENSDIAKETELNADIGAKFSLTKTISTKSKISFVNSDVRWPDYLNGTEEGMPIRYFESKFTQSLNMSFNALTIGVNGSYSNRDFSTEYSDFAPEILGTQGYQRDLNDAKLDANFDVKFNDNLSFIARPMLKHRKYKDEPGRTTQGAKGGANMGNPVREVLTNELGVDLKATLGAFTITPTATIGQDVDRALGAEDTSYTSAGLSLEIMIDKDTGLKLGASANKQMTKFDNWIEKTPNGELREDEDLNTGISAGVNLSKTVSLGVDYAREEAKSNADYSDENYNREIIGTTLTVSF